MVYATGCLVYVLWVYLHRSEIRNDGDLYLTRYKLIRTPWFRVFLHRIYRPDLDRDLHNHPWPRAFAVILRGGYRESVHGDHFWGFSHKAVAVSTRAFLPGRYHRITHVKPHTWTLFCAGRRSRDWGFLVDGRHVPHAEYLGYAVRGD